MRSLCIMILTLVSSLAAWGQHNSIDIAAAMETAEDLSEVIGVLKQMPTGLGISDRLMIYNSIPTKLLDVSASTSNLQRATTVSLNIATATELIYLLGIEENLTKGWFQSGKENRKFISKLFLDSLTEWSKINETDLNINPSELEKLEKNNLIDFSQRLENLAHILDAGLNEKQREALLAKQKDFTKRTKGEVKELIKKAYKENRSKQVIRTLKTSAAIGPFSSALFLAFMLGGGPQPATLTIAFLTAVPAMFGDIALGFTSLLALTERHFYFRKIGYNTYIRASVMNPFFDTIKASVSTQSCALSVTTGFKP